MNDTITKVPEDTSEEQLQDKKVIKHKNGFTYIEGDHPDLGEVLEELNE